MVKFYGPFKCCFHIPPFFSLREKRERKKNFKKIVWENKTLSESEREREGKNFFFFFFFFALGLNFYWKIDSKPLSSLFLSYFLLSAWMVVWESKRRQAATTATTATTTAATTNGIWEKRETKNLRRLSRPAHNPIKRT